MIRRLIERLRSDWRNGCDIHLPDVNGREFDRRRSREDAKRIQDHINGLAANAQPARRKRREHPFDLRKW